MKFANDMTFDQFLFAAILAAQERTEDEVVVAEKAAMAYSAGLAAYGAATRRSALPLPDAPAKS